jgi:FkbM family methyltransferase
VRAAWQPPRRWKQPIRRLVGSLGYEMVRLRRPATTFLSELLSREQINALVDVGANQGQYALRMRAIGYAGRIESFEPGSDAFELLKREARSDPLWNVHKTALGAERGNAQLNISQDSVSSSLLPVAQPLVAAAPGSARQGAEEVDVRRLDEAFSYSETDRLWLKLDTQGSEDAVLAGATGCLGLVRVVQTEVSLVPCYDGQADYRELFDTLHAAGFRLISVEPGTENPSTGEMLQFDAIFESPRR